MTPQNERLRALLREARDCINTEWAGNRKTIARIDAALARPGEVHPSNLTDVVTLLENDRDEARVEVERLRSLYIEARVDGFRDGRKAGAEAMREAAAQLVIREVDSWMHSSLSDEIRALPIPEDKP